MSEDLMSPEADEAQPMPVDSTRMLDYDPSEQMDKTQDIDGPEDSVKAQVASWLKKIDKAEEKYKRDFERMRENMDFVWGLQWAGQDSMDEDKYRANWTIRSVNMSVATLYAKNPTVEIRRDTNRINYDHWDGKVESLGMAMQLEAMAMRFGFPLPPDVQQTLMDFKIGRQHEQLIDRVCKTLQCLAQKQLDMQVPNFKLQMKQLVRRVNVCGVGYIKVTFCREKVMGQMGQPQQGYDEDYDYLTQSKLRLSQTDRLNMMKGILDRIDKGKVEDSSAEMEQLKALFLSMQLSPLDSENTAIREHIVLDFPRATSIVPDPDTRTLKGWVGGHWIAEKMFFPVQFVNDFFDIELDTDSDIKLYDEKNKPDAGQTVEGERKEQKKVCVYVVRDLDTKSEFTICRGHKDFLCEPEVVSPCPRDFWNLFPVTFNDIEVEEGCKATIFPPSLVDLLKPSQKEWNRTQQGRRRHRKASAPRYTYIDGTIGEDDLDRIAIAEDQEFIKLKGVPPGTEPGKVLQPLETVDVKEELYNTESLREDALLTSGQQEANQGPPQPNITATGVTIAEQSRVGVAASDIDGLDDALTSVVDCMVQLDLMEMSSFTVKQIVGRGAVFPDDPLVRRELLEEVEIKIRAGSSGKPNQAIELNKWQTESQILLQFGANPQAVIRETISRFDDHLEPVDFFPPQMPPMPAGPTANGNGGGGPPTGPSASRNGKNRQKPQVPQRPVGA